MPIRLNDRTTIEVSGSERVRFLDGLLSCDLGAASPDTLVYGALLSPQGKIITDLFMFSEDDRLVLDIPRAAAADLVKRLTLYKLRADVAVEATGRPIVVGTGLADPRHAALPPRAIADNSADLPDDRSPYDTARIDAAVADAVSDFPLGDAFPHDINMDLTGGVDFTKGCFVGQEVVSRMRHRGTARRRTVRVMADAPLPESGAELTVEGKTIGRLGTVVDRRGLAIVRIDNTEGSATVDGIAVALQLPDGAPFSFGKRQQSA